MKLTKKTSDEERRIFNLFVDERENSDKVDICPFCNRKFEDCEEGNDGCKIVDANYTYLEDMVRFCCFKCYEEGQLKF